MVVSVEMANLAVFFLTEEFFLTPITLSLQCLAVSCTSPGSTLGISQPRVRYPKGKGAPLAQLMCSIKLEIGGPWALVSTNGLKCLVSRTAPAHLECCLRICFSSSPQFSVSTNCFRLPLRVSLVRGARHSSKARANYVDLSDGSNHKVG